MRYHTVYRSAEETITAVPWDYVKAWPATVAGIKFMSVWATAFTNFYKKIKTGEYSLYEFEAPEPIILPFDMTLNYTNLWGEQDPAYNGWDGAIPARVLDAMNLERAIAIVSQYDSSDIINSAYDDMDADGLNQNPGHWFNHSREQLIHLLSCIIMSLGPVVKNRSSAWEMSEQCAVTVPVAMRRVDVDMILDASVENPVMRYPNVVAIIEPID
jgi:hypothetical protein